MIYHGLALMVCAGLPLAGVLAELRHRAVHAYHELALADPLARPRSWVARRHLRRACATCSLVAELAFSHATFR